MMSDEEIARRSKAVAVAAPKAGIEDCLVVAYAWACAICQHHQFTATAEGLMEAIERAVGIRAVATPIPDWLSARARNALEYRKISSLEQLASLPKMEVLSWRAIGKGTRAEFQQVLKQHGLSFDWWPENERMVGIEREEKA